MLFSFPFHFWFVSAWYFQIFRGGIFAKEEHDDRNSRAGRNEVSTLPPGHEYFHRFLHLSILLCIFQVSRGFYLSENFCQIGTLIRTYIHTHTHRHIYRESCFSCALRLSSQKVIGWKNVLDKKVVGCPPENPTTFVRNSSFRLLSAMIIWLHNWNGTPCIVGVHRPLSVIAKLKQIRSRDRVNSTLTRDRCVVRCVPTTTMAVVIDFSSRFRLSDPWYFNRSIVPRRARNLFNFRRSVSRDSRRPRACIDYPRASYYLPIPPIYPYQRIARVNKGEHQRESESEWERERENSFRSIARYSANSTE